MKKLISLLTLVTVIAMSAQSAFALTGTLGYSGQKTNLDDCEFDWLINETFDDCADGAYPARVNGRSGNYYNGGARIMYSNGSVSNHEGYLYAQDGCLQVAFGNTWKSPEMIHFQMDIRIPTYGKAGGVYLNPVFNDNKNSSVNLRLQDFAGFEWSKANNNEFQTLHVEFYPGASGASWAACWCGNDRSAVKPKWYPNCGRNASFSYDNICGIRLVTNNAGGTYVDNIKFGCRRMYYQSNFNEASDFQAKHTAGSNYWLCDPPAKDSNNNYLGGYVAGPMTDMSSYINTTESYDGSCLGIAGNINFRLAIGKTITNVNPTQINFAMKREADTTPGLAWGRNTSYTGTIKLWNTDAFAEAAPVGEWVYYTLKFTPASDNNTSQLDCTWKTADGRTSTKHFGSTTWNAGIDELKFFSTNSASAGTVYIDDVSIEVVSVTTNNIFTHAKAFTYEPTQIMGKVINSDAEEGKAYFVFANYDETTGRLTSLSLKPIEFTAQDATKADEFKFDLSTVSATTKVFLVNAEDLSPLADSVTLK